MNILTLFIIAKLEGTQKSILEEWLHCYTYTMEYNVVVKNHFFVCECYKQYGISQLAEEYIQYDTIYMSFKHVK